MSIMYAKEEGWVPCMDDAGDPPKNPESKIYPDICSNARVRAQSVWMNISRRHLHGIPSLITT